LRKITLEEQGFAEKDKIRRSLTKQVMKRGLGAIESLYIPRDATERWVLIRDSIKFDI
jgi:hypothetical protein